MSYSAEDILERLKSLGNPANVAGMARYGINPAGTLGISMPVLRRIAREAGKDHRLAAALWYSGLHEARILAGLVDEPGQVDEAQMERWAGDFDSWDICDQVCGNLFWLQPLAVQKAMQWSEREQEFVKRAGFVLMAELAVHQKKAGDDLFETFFIPIQREAVDGRNFVRKAVNWALRSIGKRDIQLNEKAIAVARQMMQSDSKSARWIASDALRELMDVKIQAKLRKPFNQGIAGV
jgi:3-methyladenine DNA glycosylase AlkD